MRLFRLQLEVSCLQWSFFHLQLTTLAFLLAVGAFLLTASVFHLQLEFFCFQWASASNKGLKGL